MAFYFWKCHNALGQHVWMETKGKEVGGWETGKGSEQENNFPRAPTVCSHFVMDFILFFF